MATRLYVTSRVPGTFLQGPSFGNWYAGDSSRDTRGMSGFVLRLAQTKTDGGVSLTIPLNPFTSSFPVDDQKILSYRWVTDRLDADTPISGTLQLTLRVSIPDDTLGEDVKGFVYAYVSVGDTLDRRAVLVDNVTDATNWTHTNVWRTMTFTITAANALAGDRIVVEFGANCSPGLQISNTYSVLYGTTNAANTPLADAVNGSGAAGAAWAEFSTTLTFMADPAPPANDACADAVVIGSLPYTAPVIDTTTSLDTDRAVWYTFTAPASGRVYITTWGANYSTMIRVYTGCGGSFVVGSLGTAIAWQGTGQAFSTFEATAGVSYWIQVSSYYVTAGLNAYVSAIRSGGALSIKVFQISPVAIDDLFVDCQHIVRYRGTDPICATPNFYGLTPTGNAIDYLRAPLDDLNGGTNTNERLYVALFGDPLVEILDLDTLDVTSAEIDYIADPINVAPKSVNLSSLIFDAVGMVYLGFYGDDYAVIDRLSSPNACAIRFLLNTHADNQTGAPWPASASRVVQQENGGTDFIDLAVDQETLYYTSGGRTIFKYHVPTSTQLPAFATVAPQAGPRPGLRTVRLMPPGDGSGGAIVADGVNVKALDRNGTVIKVYTPATGGLPIANDLDKVEFSSDAQRFWVTDQFSCYIWEFDLVSGAQLSVNNTGLPPGQLSGFVVYHGYRSGLNTPPVNPPGGIVPPAPLPGTVPSWIDYLVNPVPPGEGRPGCPIDLPTESPGGPGCVIDFPTGLV